MKLARQIGLILFVLVVGAGLGLGIGYLTVTNWMSFLNVGTQMNAVLILERVQVLQQLATTRYNYSITITASREMPQVLQLLYGESLALQAVGQVEAGIDLSTLTENDVQQTAEGWVIVLPAPVLLNCTLNESQTQIIQRDTGLFARASTGLDASARRYAIGNLRDRAIENGILTEAETQAKTTIENLGALLGNTTLAVQTTPANPNVLVMPTTCAG
jgi:hypothetical protein